MKPSTIALTGVTGSLGRRFFADQVERCSRCMIIALVRDPAKALTDPIISRAAQALGERLRWIKCDLTDLRLNERDRKAVVSADSVWHFAANTSLRQEGLDEEMRRVNVDGTARLIELLESTPRPPAFHHLSTAYVAGCRSDTVYENELDAGEQCRNGYERSKRQAEQLVRAWLNGRGRGMIFRPSLVLENDAGSGLNKITDVFAQLVARAIVRGERALALRLPERAGINLVPEDWVVDCMRELSAHPQAQGKCFHLTAASDTRLSRVAEVAATLAPGFRFEFRPDAPARKLSGCSRLLDAALQDLRPYLCASLAFDRTETMKVLGGNFVEPLVDLRSRGLQSLDKLISKSA